MSSFYKKETKLVKLLMCKFNMKEHEQSTKNITKTPQNPIEKAHKKLIISKTILKVINIKIKIDT